MKIRILAGLTVAVLGTAPAFAQTVLPNPVPFVAGTVGTVVTAPFAAVGAPFEGRSTFRPGSTLSDTPWASSNILNQSPSPAHPEGPDDDANIGG